MPRGAAEFLFRDRALSEICVFKPGRGKDIRRRLAGARYEPVFYDGIEILADDGFAQLSQRHSSREGRGKTGVLFPELRLMIAGFRARVPEGRYAVAFPRERLDFIEILLDV